MYEFSIWAPSAKNMTVEVNGSRHAMQGPDDRGWWRAAVEQAGPGANYGFMVDADEKPYPDPRALWQPEGVHGLSRLYDQNAFQWSDANFRAVPLASAIVYELHIGTFTPQGTLDAREVNLEVLSKLRVTGSLGCSAAPSSNGRTAAFGAANGGSNPPGAMNCAAARGRAPLSDALT